MIGSRQQTRLDQAFGIAFVHPNGAAMERRLAAILASDVVGYSRLMEQNEAGTYERLHAHRKELFEPEIEQHHGRIFKLTGDGVLAEFASVVDAVECAATLQRGMSQRNRGLPDDQRIDLRIGVHVGDVIVEGDDRHGDAVNLAARLQQAAEPGGICVSRQVVDHVRQKVALQFDLRGDERLKNFADPVPVYRLHVPGERQIRSRNGQMPLLPTKPSIAVLPFTAMAADPQQESFADGLSEDLITDLSRVPGLFVIARNSTFAYKGKPLDVRQIARDLGVRYLLEGGARRAGGRVRISAQLIDAIDGGHLWADRFDRSLDDIFAVQDEVTRKIVEALIGHLTGPPPRQRPSNLQAYDLCVRARLLIMISPGSLEAIRESNVLLRQAIDLDPSYAEAHRWLAFNLWASWAHGAEPMDPTRRLSVEHAERAVAIDPNDAGNRWVLAYVLANEHRWDEAEAQFESALQLDPNNADAWAIRAEVTTMSGRPELAIEQISSAFRLNPHPAAWYYWVLGLAQYGARDYQAAAQTLRNEATYRTGSRRVLAASLAQLGEMDEARREAMLFSASNPSFTISRWSEAQPCQDAAMLQHFIEGFRKAGLREI
jgi:TolB-like protein/class 3 adenylate cyclase